MALRHDKGRRWMQHSPALRSGQQSALPVPLHSCTLYSRAWVRARLEAAAGGRGCKLLPRSAMSHARFA